ncbi:MAG: cytochrome B [Erysipelotrichaceae bacterium]|nr:cytochrome B [Erysipelotrichaceae bacterium]MDD3810051.1 cytochrome B [Erysipelotrichaceae bacterium]
MSNRYLTTKKMALIAILGCVQYVSFMSFSFIPYLEVITSITVCFAMVFSTRDAFLGSLIFGSVYLLTTGITPWGSMYFFIYPAYSLIIGATRPILKRHFLILCLVSGLFSFATGQLLQLPFIIFSKQVTLLYMLLGLQVSLGQFALTFCFMFLTYRRFEAVLTYLNKKLFPNCIKTKKTF